MLRDRTGQDSNLKNFDGTGQDNSQTNGTGRDRIDLGGNSDGTGQDRDPVLSCPVPQDRIDPVTSPGYFFVDIIFSINSENKLNSNV